MHEQPALGGENILAVLDSFCSFYSSWTPSPKSGHNSGNSAFSINSIAKLVVGYRFVSSLGTRGALKTRKLVSGVERCGSKHSRSKELPGWINNSSDEPS